jgi:hypothetical protein
MHAHSNERERHDGRIELRFEYIIQFGAITEDDEDDDCEIFWMEPVFIIRDCCTCKVNSTLRKLEHRAKQYENMYNCEAAGNVREYQTTAKNWSLWKSAESDVVIVLTQLACPRT